MTSSFTSAHSLSASTFSLTPRATSQSDDDDDLASLPSGSDASDQDLSVWSDEESDAEAEWRESMQQLELLVSMVIIPFVGKFLGRKCAYWGWSKMMGWKYPIGTFAKGVQLAGSARTIVSPSL